MTRILALSAVALAALSACDNSDHTITAGDPYDPQANAVANLQEVELPPSIVAADTYRCKDNSLLAIEWLSNDTARAKPTPDAAPIALTKGEDGAYAAEGQTLTGAPNDQSITFNGQSCRR